MPLKMTLTIGLQVILIKYSDFFFTDVNDFHDFLNIHVTWIKLSFLWLISI